MPANAHSATLLGENVQYSAELMSAELQIHHQNHEEHPNHTDHNDGGFANPSTPNVYVPTDTIMLYAENIISQSVAQDVDFSPPTETVTAATPPTAPSTWPNHPPPDVPMAMSQQLSHQLEQIQEAQVNDIGIVGHMGSFHFNNSTTPTLLYLPLPPASADLGGAGSGDVEDMVGSSNPTWEQILAMPQIYPPTTAENHIATATNTLPHILNAPPLSVPHIPQFDAVESVTEFGLTQLAYLNTADLDMVEVDVNQHTHALGLYEFIRTWGHRVYPEQLKKKARIPVLSSLEKQRINPPKQISRRDLQGDKCDIQGVDWLDMGVTRKGAREARQLSYKNYESLQPSTLLEIHEYIMSNRRSQTVLPNHDNFLRFRRMDLQHKPHLSHFQLRNLIACTSRSNVFYAGKNKVQYSNPLMNESSTIMDLTDPDIQPLNLQSSYGGVQISTIATKHDILLAGGFNGEYGMINLNSTVDSGHTEGLITDHLNSITNHISISLSRASGLPQAAFASNDNGIRVLDCTTNTFNTSHTYYFPVNCTAISPDSRLRVIVGDTKYVHICDAETGKTLQELDGHRDFGFACAWADNGWHVATGNQDMTVKIWDARMWTDRYGRSKPLKTIKSELAGVRSLQFSPLGSGKRILLACEAADFIDVIDAETFESKQVLDFFGEIGGACFTPDGQDVFVAHCDPVRGGVIEFERTGQGARLGYRMNQEDIGQINSELARRDARAWLDDEGEPTGSQKYKTKKSETPNSMTMDYSYDTSMPCVTNEEDASPKKYIGREGLYDILGNPWKPDGRPGVGVGGIEYPNPKFSYNDLALLLTWGFFQNDEEQKIFMDGISIEEQMRRHARGYDWRQTDADLIADTRSNGRTPAWYRRRHLFGTGTSEPLGGDSSLGGQNVDIGL